MTGYLPLSLQLRCELLEARDHFRSAVVTRCVKAGVPTTGPQASRGLRPVRNPATQKEASGQWAKLRLPAPISGITAWTVSPATHPWKKCLPINWSLDQKCWGPLFKAMPCGFLLLLLPGPCKCWKWGEYTMHFNQRLVIYCFHDDKDLNLVSSKWPFLWYASIYHSVKEIGMLYTLEQFVTHVNNSWQ